jgi:hypothetical protein
MYTQNNLMYTNLVQASRKDSPKCSGDPVRTISGVLPIPPSNIAGVSNRSLGLAVLMVWGVAGVEAINDSDTSNVGNSGFLWKYIYITNVLIIIMIIIIINIDLNSKQT